MIRIRTLTFLLILLSILAVASCNKNETGMEDFHPTPYFIQIPGHFPTNLNIPADNPMTVEGVTLGRFLFYEGRMSGRSGHDSLMSCSSCHLQLNSFECGIDNPHFPGGKTFGITGIPTPHYMLPLINNVWTDNGFLWNGFVNLSNPSPQYRNLEDLVWMSITAPHEMNSDTNRVKAIIQNTKGYPELFKKAFGSDVVTVKNMGKAVAQFIRTLISADSKFDRFMRGEVQLNASELNGYVLFMTEQGADCFHCHGGDGNPLFTTNLFYNNGKDSIFNDPRDRYGVSGNAEDIGAYKAPTLRNLAFTAPYMHDGRFITLDEVIEFYSSGLVWSPSISPLMHHIPTGGAQLTPTEKADLKAFLLSLSDSSFITDPAFSKPEKMPDE